MTLGSRRYGLLIGGVEVAGSDGAWFESRDPASGDSVGLFARATADDVRAAVRAARSAHTDGWGDFAPTDRGRILQGVARAVLANAEELATHETRDCGKRISLARQDVSNAARYFEFFGNLAAGVGGQQIPLASNVLDLTLREPYGVSAQINAWNFPLSMAARSLAAALAMGNTVVLKTSEHAPLTTALLGRLIPEFGVPPGVVNMLHGYGYDCGAALAAADDIDLLTFTGSVAAGIEVARAAARTVTPCVLELGGKSPAVVFADANLEEVARQLSRALVDSNGQCCDLPSRALVESSVHDEFVDLLTAQLASMTPGPGLDDHDWGPLINEAQADRAAAMISRACESARLAFGGRRRQFGGVNSYIEPTVLVDVAEDLEIAREEVFAPVLAVTRFDTESDAVRLANGTPYGLAAFLWSADIGRAVRVTRAIRAGQVFVNCFGSGDPVMTPFGGTGRSGYGREKGAAALETYSRIKNVCIAATT